MAGHLGLGFADTVIVLVLVLVPGNLTIGIGWNITWFTYAADYSRLVSTEVRKRKLYPASVLGQFIPVVCSESWAPAWPPAAARSTPES